MTTGATFAEVQRFAGRRRCATCKGLLEVVIRDGQYIPFCPSSRGEHRDFELIPSGALAFIEHLESVKTLPPGEATKEDLW